eukprot:INCI3128.1.p1 GENE.INCI3128.1~~INCI3128.1.p1  ORF type:complete len:834 (-),score=139.46 INCI3128.1:270-2771(-)
MFSPALLSTGRHDDPNATPISYVVPQSQKNCSGALLFHNSQLAMQSLLGSMKSVLMNRFTQYFAVLRHSTLQFYETQDDFNASARPVDIFVLQDGHICKKVTKRSFDGSMEYRIMIVSQKSNGGITTLAEIVAPPGHGQEHINIWFNAMLRVLAMLRMVRIQHGLQLPIPKMECHGWLTKKAIAKAGSNRRRFFVGHLNLLCYFADDKALTSPIRVLEIAHHSEVKIEDHERREVSVSFPGDHPKLVLQASDPCEFSRWFNYLNLAQMWAMHRQQYRACAKRLRDDRSQNDIKWELACRYWSTHVLTQSRHLGAYAAAGVPHERRPAVWAALSGTHNWFARRLHDPLHLPSRGTVGMGAVARRRTGSSSSPLKGKIVGGRSPAKGGVVGSGTFAGSKLASNATALSMQSLLLRYSTSVKEDRIERDLDRTFPLVEFFAQSPSEDPGAGQDMLKQLLRAYAAYDPEVQYCQGMNWIAGLIICAWAPPGRLVEIDVEEPETFYDENHDSSEYDVDCTPKAEAEIGEHDGSDGLDDIESTAHASSAVDTQDGFSSEKGDQVLRSSSSHIVRVTTMSTSVGVSVEVEDRSRIDSRSALPQHFFGSDEDEDASQQSDCETEGHAQAAHSPNGITHENDGEAPAAVEDAGQDGEVLSQVVSMMTPTKNETARETASSVVVSEASHGSDSIHQPAIVETSTMDTGTLDVGHYAGDENEIDADLRSTSEHHGGGSSKGDKASEERTKPARADCDFALTDSTFDESAVQLAAAERAFWVFVTLMERPCFAMRSMFMHGMAKLDALLTKFDALLKRCLPDLHAHVNHMKLEAKIPDEVSTPRM